jgi:hypothetical protein
MMTKACRRRGRQPRALGCCRVDEYIDQNVNLADYAALSKSGLVIAQSASKMLSLIFDAHPHIH